MNFEISEVYSLPDNWPVSAAPLKREVYTKVFKLFEYSGSNKISLFFNELPLKTVAFTGLAFKTFEELNTHLLYITSRRGPVGAVLAVFGEMTVKE